MDNGGDSGAVALGLVSGATELAKSDLAEDLERTREIAQDVADATDGTCEWAKQRRGYRVRLPMTDDDDDDRIILVRVIARSSARDNYYRVIFPDKGPVDEDGEYSNDQKKTHHDISDDSVSEILELIDKIREREA